MIHTIEDEMRKKWLSCFELNILLGKYVRKALNFEGNTCFDAANEEFADEKKPKVFDLFNHLENIKCAQSESNCSQNQTIIVPAIVMHLFLTKINFR